MILHGPMRLRQHWAAGVLAGCLLRLPFLFVCSGVVRGLLAVIIDLFLLG